jgi:hypothetical protein
MSMNFTTITRVYEAAGVGGFFVPYWSAPVDR